MIVKDYTLEIKRYDPTDPRLGRHKRWDSRSKSYFIPEADDFSQIHDVVHHCYLPDLNQLQVGSCAGDTGTEVMGSDDLWPAVEDVLSTTDEKKDQDYAYQLYSDATKIDPYPGTWYPDGRSGSEDTGTDGLSIAQVLQTRGLISGFQHGSSLLSTLTGLQERSMMTGTNWLGDMFNPTSDGQIKATGNVEGGHEYTLFAVDTVNKRVWMRNHWGEWGVGYPSYADTGCAWMTWDDYEKLQMDDGDSTLLVPNSQPAPTPTPVPPIGDLADQNLADVINPWLARPPRYYKHVQNALVTWLSSKGL